MTRARKHMTMLVAALVLVVGGMAGCENWMIEKLLEKNEPAGAEGTKAPAGVEGTNSDNGGGVTPSGTTDIAVERVVISPSGDLGGVVGGFMPLVATIYPAEATNKGVIWETSDEDVVAIGKDSGLVTLMNFKKVSTEDVTITVKTKDGDFKDSRKVKVVELANVVPATGVGITGNPPVEGFVGDYLQLVAKVTPENATNQGVEWESGNPAAALVAGGLVILLQPAENVTITARAGGGSDTHTIKIKPVPVDSIGLNVTSLSLDAGGSPATLIATVLPYNATNKNVTWSIESSSPAGVVSGSDASNGVVTPVIPGTATIRATSASDDTKYAECTVMVKAVPVTGIILTADRLSMEEEGSTLTLGATVYPTNATNQSLIWVPGNDSVASISGSGTSRTVTPNGVGETEITVKTDTGITVSCKVTVNKSKNLAVKFKAQGTGSALVTDIFTKIHEYLNGISSPFIDAKIELGDYVDLPSSFAVHKYPTDDTGTGEIEGGSLAATNPDSLRLIVVGINSFNAHGEYKGSGGSNPNIAHIVMHFKDTPVGRSIEPAGTSNRYFGSEIQAYLVPVVGKDGSGTFYKGLMDAGVPLDKDDIIWAPTRYVSNGGSTATDVDPIEDKIWLPTEWEMLNGTKWSSPLETEINQTWLEYYDSDDRRKKPFIYNGHYWEASPRHNFANSFCNIRPEGNGNSYTASGYALGVAPAFCVK